MTKLERLAEIKKRISETSFYWENLDDIQWLVELEREMERGQNLRDAVGKYVYENDEVYLDFSYLCQALSAFDKGSRE